MKPTEIQFALNLEALAAPQCRRIVEVLVQDSQILIQTGLVKVRSVDGVKKAHLQASKFKPTLDWFIKLNP
jgi:hypothetical protein